MQGIDVRSLLKNFLDECPKCRMHFMENVVLVIGDDETLTDEQVDMALIMLNDFHRQH